LSRLHTQVAKLLAELPAVIEPEISRLGLIGALQLTIEREFKDEFDRIEWRIIDPAEQMSRNLPPMHSEILYYAAREAIRNAARHGRGHNPNRPLQLSLQVSWDKGLQMVFEDNGIGIQKTEPTKKTPDQLNSGRGLALHSTLMAAVGGSLALESSPGAYTRVSLFLPEVQT
jgi:signal transduction histidine kinase